MPEPPPPPSPDCDRQLLRLWLADRDIACGACGYNLRGLTGDTCPECNVALHIPVQMTAFTGFGPGSLAIWFVPLTTDLLACLAGIANSDLLILIPTVVLMLPAATLFAIAESHVNKQVHAKSTADYWKFTRVLVGLHAALVVIAFLSAAQ